MKFVKMHGIGNDYVYVDCFSQPSPEDPSALAVEISRPHTGVGSDGLILVVPCEGADARMRIFNKDGSEGEMCGNGIRCVGKYLFDSGIAPIRIGTLTGLNHAPKASRRQEHPNVCGFRVCRDLSRKNSAHAQHSPRAESASSSGACAREVRFSANSPAAQYPAFRPPSKRPHSPAG